MAKQPELDQNFFRLWEDSRREQLENHVVQPANIDGSLKSRVDNLPQTLESLRAEYLRDRNPVLVWTAIQNIELATRYHGSAIPFPPWVLAYLFTAAAGIGGMAAAWPREPKHEKDMVGDCYFDEEQRRTDLAMRALAFKTSKGKNPFRAAHKSHGELSLLGRRDSLTGKGHSKKEAADLIDDVALSYVDDRARKLRGIERKHKK